MKVTEFNAELNTLVEEMFESMYAAQGIGLAAPQIAISKRIAVVDLSFNKNAEERIALINPEITVLEGKQSEEEGCLSLPDIREKVQRAEHVKVRATRTSRASGLRWKAMSFWPGPCSMKLTIWDGVLFIDRLSRLKRELVLRKIRKLQKNGEW